MSRNISSLLAASLLVPLAFIACQDDASRIAGPGDPGALLKYGPPTGGGGGEDDGAGNNLSFPVVWAEGVTKALRVPPDGGPQIGGEWWWWWGVIEGSEGTADIPLACAPLATDETRCADGTTPGAGAIKAYVQKDPDNIWQAGTVSGVSAPVNVDSIDWGDDLESKDWNLSSQVRIEHVLSEIVGTPLTEYGMRHLSGWGADEQHGLAVPGGVVETIQTSWPTVFSPCARLTIQKLTTTRDNADALGTLVWDATSHQWTGTYVNAPIFNKAVWEAADGPGYYNAEVNVKGKLIYGYTWGVRRLNSGVGDYRITFSLDATCSGASVNTFITSGTTIVQAEEEEVVVAAEPEGGGGVGVLRPDLNLTYMDVRITSQKGGGGKGRR